MEPPSGPATGSSSGASPATGSPAKADQVARSTRVEQLVAGGRSRLTAERIVAIEEGEELPGRARRHHSQARR
jgi:hypothetical protein